MSSLSKAHDLAYKLYVELEELKESAWGPATEDEINRLYEVSDGLQSDIYDLKETQL